MGSFSIARSWSYPYDGVVYSLLLLPDDSFRLSSLDERVLMIQLAVLIITMMFKSTGAFQLNYHAFSFMLFGPTHLSLSRRLKAYSTRVLNEQNSTKDTPLAHNHKLQKIISATLSIRFSSWSVWRKSIIRMRSLAIRDGLDPSSAKSTEPNHPVFANQIKN